MFDDVPERYRVEEPAAPGGALTFGEPAAGEKAPDGGNTQRFRYIADGVFGGVNAGGGKARFPRGGKKGAVGAADVE